MTAVAGFCSLHVLRLLQSHFLEVVYATWSKSPKKVVDVIDECLNDIVDHICVVKVPLAFTVSARVP